MPVLLALGLMFAELSLVAFGGGNAILPEMQRRVVEVHGWMSAETFGALFALAQAAPGPNMMVVALIGWHVAGLSGALVAALATFGPSSVLAAGTVHLWDRFRDHPWRRAAQAGLVPITAGLVAASAVLITGAVAPDGILAAIVALAAAAAALTRLHPLAILAAGALLGLAFGRT